MPTATAIPWTLRLLCAAIHCTDWIIPPLACRWVTRIWFNAPRYTAPQRELAWLNTAQRQVLNHRLGNIVYYRWGETNRPYVLLVHGWSGRGAQLAAFADPCRAAGFAVVTLDAPAHGESPGHQTSAFAMAEVVHDLIQFLGPAHAIIAHSFGGIVSAYALRKFSFPLQRLVIIASPATVGYLLAGFVIRLKISARLQAAFTAHLEKMFGADLWRQLAVEENVKALHLPILIVHDKQDTDVDWQQAQRIAKQNPKAELLFTDGLGHRRILRDADVIQRIVEFIR
ncbi:MAG: alpha/beta fold hydrolase [Gammaproteobacteria bacterium]|nr:alpha/beta fold hydrolase [Gammaproteobacteria bacterium]